MKQRRISSVAILIGFVVLVPPMALFSTTVLDKAESFFQDKDWVVDDDYITRSETPGVAIHGGTETFPAMNISSGHSSALIYPEIEGLGFLDFTKSPEGLLPVLNSISDDFAVRKVSSQNCSEIRSFLPVVTTHRLARIPVPKVVWFGKPSLVSGLTSSGRYSVRYRLECSKSSEVIPLFLDVFFISESGSWKIDEIIFDGDSYARLVWQN